MTDREKVFLILGYAQGDIEIIVTLAAIADLPIALFDECGKSAKSFQDEIAKIECK